MSRIAALAAEIVAQAKADRAQGNDAPLADLADVRLTQNLGKVRVIGVLDLRDMVAEGLAPKKVEAPKKAAK